jgi:hypothetical protein
MDANNMKHFALFMICTSIGVSGNLIKPINNDANFKITTWGGTQLCEPHFIYRVDIEGISINYQNTLIESQPDTSHVFQILKGNINVLRKIKKMKSKCHVFDDAGIAIAINDETFSISSADLDCKEFSPKLRQQLQSVLNQIYAIKTEFTKRRNDNKDTRFESSCN